MRIHNIVILIALDLSCSRGEKIHKRKKQKVVFSDDFDSETLDLKKWEHEVTAWGGGNEEFQAFVPDEENSYTSDGMLHIKPTLMEDKIDPRTNKPFGRKWLTRGEYNLTELYGWCTEDTNWGCFRDRGNIPPIASARLQTKSSFSFMYGTVEIIAKLPKGDWLWPAIWMVPVNATTDKGWPYDGEIDIVEARGNMNLKDTDGSSIGIDLITCAMHMCRGVNSERFIGKSKLKNMTWADEFHNFTLEWRPESLTFYVDGTVILTYDKKAEGSFDKYCPDSMSEWKERNEMFPFDKHYYLILSLAVGGRTGFFHDDFTPPKPWENNGTFSAALREYYDAKSKWFPTWDISSTMLVDSVKVTQEEGWQSDFNASTNNNLEIACVGWMLVCITYVLQE